MAIQSIIEHFNNYNLHDQIWLVVGKGPSFDDIRGQDLKTYKTIGLNHASTAIDTEYAHFVDFDAFLDCADKLRNRRAKVIMPFYPHINFKPSSQNLEHFVQSSDQLKWFCENNLLFTYDLSSSKTRAFQYPLVYGCYFSGEIAVKLLATCGAQTIFLAGVDGGTTYSGAFGYLKDKTLLANGHQSFSIQNREIAKTKLKFKDLKIKRFRNRNRTFKIFVGSERAQKIPYEVLKYSIQINSIESIEVFDLSEELRKKNITSFAADISKTPFSLYRFFIPQLCDSKGHAAYLDSDMLVLSDIVELFDYLTDDLPIVSAQPTGKRAKQNSVFVVDCEKISWEPEKLLESCRKSPEHYKPLMESLNLKQIMRPIPYHWNSLEAYNRDTKLIHYTDMNRQPWVFKWNLNGSIWLKYLNAAIQDGALSYDDIWAAAKCRLVRPSLLKDIHQKSFLSFLPSLIAKPLLDYKFKAPYKYLVPAKKNLE